MQDLTRRDFLELSGGMLAAWSLPAVGLPCLDDDPQTLRFGAQGPICPIGPPGPQGPQGAQALIIECGCCGCFHRYEYDGDCRDNDERFGDLEDACERLGIPVVEVWDDDEGFGYSSYVLYPDGWIHPELRADSDG